MSDSLIKKKSYMKHTKKVKNQIIDFLGKFFERIAHSLISSERPQQIAYGPSFVLSNLSDSLTVAHFL